MSVSRTLRKYRGWIAAVALIAVAGAAYFAFRQSGADSPTTNYQTEQASKGTLSVTVSGTGNLEVDGTTDVYPDAAGTVDTVSVAEGDAVATGTVLFTLDATDAEANTASALASYRRAQQSVAQAEASLLKAENTLADLEDRYSDQVAATSAGTTVASTNTAPSATGTAATATTAATTQDEITQGDIDAAEADVTSAEAGLASAKADRTTAQMAYEDAQAAEDDLEITAPCSGIVWSLEIESGDSVAASEGSSTNSSAASGAAAATGGTTTASSSSAPVVLAPEQPLTVLLAVNEVDLPSLKVGQRADIEFDALPDLTATGKVIEIADEGTVSSGVVTYDVRLSIDVADEGLRAGMSAAATIVTDVAKDAVLVSNAAVKSNDDGSSYVLVLEDGATEPVQVTVEVGLSGSTQTQIVSGLDDGATVVTQTSSSSSGSSDSSDGSESRTGIMMPGMGGPGGPQ